MQRFDWSFLEDFSRRTGIRAFSFATTSRTFLERIFWYLAILICLVLTVQDVTNSINTYRSHPTATNVKIVINDSLNLGTPTFCIEIAPFRMISQNMNSDSQSLLRLLKSVGNITDFLIKVLVNMNFERTQNISKNIGVVTLTDNSTIHNVVGILTIVFTNIVRAEHFARIPSVSYNYTWGRVKRIKSYGADGNKLISLVSEGSMMVATVALYLSQNQYSLASLQSLISEIICNKILFTTKSTRLYHGGERIRDFCGEGKVSWLGPAPFHPNMFDLICMRMRNDFFLFSTNEDATQILADIDNLYGNTDPIESTEFLFLNFGNSLHGEEVIFPRSQNVFYAETRSKLNLNIMVQSVHRKTKTPLNDCSTGRSPDSCKFDCRNQLIVDTCGCQPLSASDDGSRNLSICGTYEKDIDLQEFVRPIEIPGFDRCPEIREFQFPNNDCTKKCLVPCQSAVLTFQIIPRSDSNELPTHMRIYAETFSFPLMEEVSLYGVKELIAFLGGNLSFYLGANFLVLLHALLYWVQMPFWRKFDNNRHTFQMKMEGETVIDTSANFPLK